MMPPLGVGDARANPLDGPGSNRLDDALRSPVWFWISGNEESLFE